MALDVVDDDHLNNVMLTVLIDEQKQADGENNVAELQETQIQPDNETQGKQQQLQPPPVPPQPQPGDKAQVQTNDVQ